jgi:hemoglobin
LIRLSNRTIFERLKEMVSLYERLGGHRGIGRLLHAFYADVRQHETIGPIFNRQIQDWPAHILKITEFWALATGGPSMYAGQMPLKHLALGLEPAHFQHWLALWDFNVRRHLPAAEAEEMSELAHGIGARLREIVGRGAGAPGVAGFIE